MRVGSNWDDAFKSWENFASGGISLRDNEYVQFNAYTMWNEVEVQKAIPVTCICRVYSEARANKFIEYFSSSYPYGKADERVIYYCKKNHEVVIKTFAFYPAVVN